MKENNSDIENRTKKLYEDIHPFIVTEETIQDYLQSTAITEEYFRNKKILDCGFGGTGWAVELFARSGADVNGIDLNHLWVEKVGNRVRKKHPDAKLNLQAGNVLALPFEGNTFDYVHSHGVMHHTVDWKKGISEMIRVAKPGGKIYLMLYGKFAPVGRFIHFGYRTAGKIIPYKFTNWVVQKTGLYRDHEISLLDAMYVPIEEHLSPAEIESVLNNHGCINIEFRESAKWKKRKFYSSPLMFGKNIQNIVLAQKPL